MDLAHAASLGRIDEVRRIVHDDPDAARRVRPVEALITGGAQFETPLEAARRRQRDEVVALLSNPVRLGLG